MKKNILRLEKYRKKYRRCDDRLVFYTKEEVKLFNERNVKSNDKDNKDFLLKGRNYALIGDTYYEVPKKFSRSWFKNINPLIKASICIIILAAIIFGILKGFNLISPVASTYDISFDCGEGGTIGKDRIKTINGKSVIEVAPNPIKEGYVFDGWWEKKELVGSTYVYSNKVTFPYTLKQNTTLFCKWIETIGESIQISFESNGGSVINPINIKYNTALPSNLEKPVKLDYKFDNWYYDSEFKKPIDTTTKLVKDTKLYAKYNKSAFKINFYTDGSKPEGTDGDSSPYSLSHVTELTQEPITTKQDKSFIGWYLGKDGTGEKITYPYVSTNYLDIDLCAKWGTAPTYKVSFNTDGGSPVEDLTCSQISTAPVSTKEHYILLGWSTIQGSKENIIDFTKAGGYQVKQDQTLYAIWEQSEFVVKLHHDGKEDTISYATKIEKPNYPKKDYELQNWYFKEDFVGEPIQFPLTLTKEMGKEDKNIHLYAKYVRNAYTINIYDENTVVETYSSISKLSEDIKPKIKKDNFIIDKFVVKKEGKDDFEVKFNGENINTTLKDYIINEDSLNVYIVWKPCAYNLTLIYPSYCPVTSISLSSQTSVDVDKLEKFSVANYTFLKWTKDSETGEEVKGTITLNDNTTLYAHYTQTAFKVTLKYQVLGASEAFDTKEIKNLKNGTHNVNELPKEDNIKITDTKYRKFIKWTNNGTDITEFTLNDDNTTLTAIYDEIISADVTLYYQIGEDKTKFKILANQSLIELSSLPDPSVADYVVSKYTKMDGTEITGTSIYVDQLGDSKSIVLVLERNCFSLILDPNGGEVLIDKINHIKSGTKIDKSSVPTPTKGTLTFNGWYKDKACSEGQQFDFDNDTMPSNDLTLYAKWSDVVTETTVIFHISDDDYSKGARFVNKSEEEMEGQTYTSKKITVNSYDCANTKYTYSGKDYVVYRWYTISGTEKPTAEFPYTGGGSYDVYAEFAPLATNISLQLDARDGEFPESTGGGKIHLFTPAINSTWADFKKTQGSKIIPTLTDYDFKYWEMYDATTQTKYREIPDDYVFRGNLFLYAHFEDEIQKKGTVTFESCNWATLTTEANKGIDNLRDFFSKDKSFSFVTLKKTLKCNGINYTTIVIGENHDPISTMPTKNAALTFQFYYGICTAAYGPSIKVEGTTINKWETSVPRSTLKAGGDIYAGIDIQLTNRIKTVNKSTMKGGPNDDSGEYVTTEDTLFLLSGVELGLDTTSTDYKNEIFTDTIGGTAGIEGSCYEYYKTDSVNRRKKSLQSKTTQNVQYWMRSPFNSTCTGTWAGTKGLLSTSIASNGEINTNYQKRYPDNMLGIFPGFAIGVY